MCEGVIQVPKSTWKRFIPFFTVDHNVDLQRWALVRERTNTLKKSVKVLFIQYS